MEAERELLQDISIHSARVGGDYLLDGVTQAEIENHKDNYGVIDWDTVIEKYGTVINEYLDEDGEFIQLQDGTNTLTYTADEGTNYLSVSVYYRISYLGV